MGTVIFVANKKYFPISGRYWARHHKIFHWIRRLPSDPILSFVEMQLEVKLALAGMSLCCREACAN